MRKNLSALAAIFVLCFYVAANEKITNEAKFVID